MSTGRSATRWSRTGADASLALVDAAIASFRERGSIEEQRAVFGAHAPRVAAAGLDGGLVDVRRERDGIAHLSIDTVTSVAQGDLRYDPVAPELELTARIARLSNAPLAQLVPATWDEAPRELETAPVLAHGAGKQQVHHASYFQQKKTVEHIARVLADL